ncbi:MAG: HAMP domain-containing protein [Endomicrobia bacterium]|nr:HAMP domain-containing protein [Endomicrobiia bacterium]
MYDKNGNILTESGSAILKEEMLQLKKEIFGTKETIVKLIKNMSETKILDIYKAIILEERKEETLDILFSEENSSDETVSLVSENKNENIKFAGVARVGMSLTPIVDAIESTTIMCIRIGIVSLVLGIIIIFFMTRKLLTPIKVLTKSVKAISSGNLEQYVEVNSEDELENLQKHLTR